VDMKEFAIAVKESQKKLDEANKANKRLEKKLASVSHPYHTGSLTY